MTIAVERGGRCYCSTKGVWEYLYPPAAAVDYDDMMTMTMTMTMIMTMVMMMMI